MDNNISLKLRLFDTVLISQKEFGKYENILLSDLNVSALMKEVRKTFAKELKEFEISITNQQKGIL